MSFYSSDYERGQPHQRARSPSPPRGPLLRLQPDHETREHLMEIKKADSKGRVSGFIPDRHYFITGPMDGSYRVKEVPVVDSVPEGYELAEIVDAQNAVLDLLYDKGLDESEEDLISLSTEIVRELQKVGVGKVE